MTAFYTYTSQVAKDPNSIFWLEKGTADGRTTITDIQDALDEYERNYNSGAASKAEILTLHRAFPDSPTYKQAAIGIQKMDMVEPMVIGGPASVELIDREGHLITTQALDRAFQKFMGNQRTRNVMVLHSDVQVGWALPAYISKGGMIYKSGVGDNGLFFICELRDDTSIAKKVSDQINQGLLKSYSIAGSATKVQNMKKGMTPYMQVDEMELAEVTVCEKGVNQGASFDILKAELPQTGKVDKDQCGYRDATAPETAMGINCGHCKYFNAERKTCDVVVGDIQPGDYCRLFEACEEGSQPHVNVHRKIVIMRSEDTGKINFQKSFLEWMQKEKDPLKGKSFTTLENFAGRESEHHRLLQEYGFPSEVPLDAMRYTPVVETETDDDGKPINIIPPWVVNEAGQDLGDKLDEDAPTFKKSIDIFTTLLQKKRKSLDKAPIGVSQFDPSDPSRQQAPKPQAPENQYQIGQGQPQTSTPTPNVPTPNVPAPDTGASTAPPSYVPQQPMTQREQRGKEFGEMRRGADKPLGRMKRLFRAGQRGAGRSLDRQADRLGRGISYLDRGRKNIGGGITDTLSGVREGYQSGYEVPEEGRKKVGRFTPGKVREGDLRRGKDEDEIPSYDKPSAARKLGRLFGAGSRAGQSITGRTAAAGARQAARTGRGAYRAGVGGARGLIGAKGEDQPRSGFGFNQERRAERDKERIGGVGGSGQAGYRAGRALRELGRGALRGIKPGESSGTEGKGGRSFGRESTAEQVGRLFGTGAKATARKLGSTPATAAKEKIGQKLQERSDRKAAERQTQQRAERQQARLQRSLEGERIGQGSGAFRPSDHEGMSAGSRHDDVSAKLSDISNGYNLSPKDWMSVIHHLTQNSEGQRFAHFNDVDIPGESWHGASNRIGAKDMKKHIQRMVDNGQISFGEHGGEGQRALDSIMGKLENAHTNKVQMPMKRLTETRSAGLDEDEPSRVQPERVQTERRSPETQEEGGTPDELMARRREQARRDKDAEAERRRKDKEDKPASEGWGPNPMDMAWDNDKPPVHKVFAKAFGLTKTRR